MHRTEPSRLQSIALQLSDKVASLVENNERLMEIRQGNFGFQNKGRLYMMQRYIYCQSLWSLCTSACLLLINIGFSIVVSSDIYIISGGYDKEGNQQRGNRPGGYRRNENPGWKNRQGGGRSGYQPKNY